MISVLIPALNEGPHIATTVSSFLSQENVSESVEIIVLDGGSSDDTVGRARTALGKHGTVIPNPGRTVSSAARIGVEMSSGDKIVIAGAHAEYPPSFLAVLSRALEDPTVGAAGGVLESLPGRKDSGVGIAIADTLGSRLGVGFSHRQVRNAKEKDVDTVAFPMYRRELFAQLGNYEPKFVRAQDLDFHLRLTNAGWRIVQVPDVIVGYRVRSTYPDEARMAFQYGYWKPLINRYHRRLSSVRQLFPPAIVLFVLFVFVGVLMGAVSPMVLLAPSAYLTLLLIGSVNLARRTGRWRLLLLYLFSYLVLHSGYGIGYLSGLVRAMINPIRKDPVSTT